jgi:chemotaxis protein methyltransferase CheR
MNMNNDASGRKTVRSYADPRERNGSVARSGCEPIGVLSVFDRVPRHITEAVFVRFQDLIYRESGIWLSEAKTALLVGRLAKRLRHYGLHSFKDYYRLVANSPEERIQMLDAISTNETHFFREPRHFELLATTIFPEWTREAACGKRQRKIRVWSAGCSTGQEPYSIAMVLLDHFPPNKGWEIEIIGTDLYTRTLEVAQQGIWPVSLAREIPRQYLKEFMLKGVREEAGRMKAGPEIRSVVRFVRLNLNDASYPLQGNFDLILCRNVLIYFDLHSRGRVVRHVLEYLSPKGYFFVGHAESLHSVGGILRTITPTVCAFAPTPGAEHDVEV